MKIISCHIENFGKLQDYSVHLDDRETIICEENGWGKSTFAAFIRAMFYGLEGERKRSIEENERKRYKPWQGGIFGGQLTFEVKDKQYTVSRIFHDKEAQDEFELRDAKTNLISTDYSKRLGEELFQINRESFMRTIFIGQNGCETSATDDINAKIGNLTDNSNDLNSYEAACARLTEIVNSLTPNRVTGSLSRRAGEIARLERVVTDGSRIGESIDTYQKYLQEEAERYELLKSEMEAAGRLQSNVSSRQIVLAKKAEWIRLKTACEERKEEAASIQKKFPGKVPTLAEINNWLAECLLVEKSAERVSLYSMTDEEAEELANSEAIFAHEIPKEASLEEMMEAAKKLSVLRRDLMSEQMSPAEAERLKVLEQKFSDDEESVSSVSAKWNNRNATKAAQPSNQEALNALETSLAVSGQGRTKTPVLAIAGMAAAIAVAGIILAFTISLTIGVLVVVVGVILFIVGLLGNRKSVGTADQELLEKISNLQAAIDEAEEFVRRTDGEVAGYLVSHGKLFEETMVSSALQELAGEYIEYTNLKKKADAAKESNRPAEAEKLKERIGSFLLRYRLIPMEERFAEDLYMLKEKSSRYLSLRDKKKQLAAAKEAYEAARGRIHDFLRKFGYEPANDLRSQLSAIRNHADDYGDAQKLLAEATADLADFREKTDVSVLMQEGLEEELPSLEELNQKMIELAEEMRMSQNTIMGYNKTLDNLEDQYDEWEESRLQLEELKKQQNEEKKKFEHVTKARVYLGLAREAITAKYADPILESFSSYYELITRSSAEKFHMDANTSVTVDELGKQRETTALSSGYRDLIGICLRIAFVDAMYQDEVPVLIMDDPFTNLDDRKLTAGMELIRQIAEKYQIIYLTCSNARS